MRRRHPYGALLAALVPVVALIAALPLVNRLEPVVLGFPFLLFWILGWVLATPLFLALAHILVDAPDDDRDLGTKR